MLAKLIAGFGGKPAATPAAPLAPPAEPAIGYSGPGIHVVSATRLSEAAFWETSLLGVSLRRIEYLVPVKHTITFENRAGLPTIYNAALATMDTADIAVFMHDDVTVHDFHLPHRLAEGLRTFDVIGPAGHAAPAADHAGWLHRLPAGATLPVAEDDESTHGLSGCVNHLFPDHELLSRYGPAPRRVALLDGVLIAAPVAVLRRHDIRFDERFQFHFYDIDFCRSCTANGLRLGTWPLAIGHASTGAFNSPAWRGALVDYRNKWGVTAPTL